MTKLEITKVFWPGGRVYTSKIEGTKNEQEE